MTSPESIRDWERARQRLADERERRTRAIEVEKTSPTPDVSRIAIWEGELAALSGLCDRLSVSDRHEITAVLADEVDRLIGAEFAGNDLAASTPGTR